MNALDLDRQAIEKALESTSEYLVDDTQPETISAGTLLLDSVTFAPGDTFGSLLATYRYIAVLDAYDAASALTEQARITTNIHDALKESGAGDLQSAGALYNLTDAASGVYPAFDIEISSTI